MNVWDIVIIIAVAAAVLAAVLIMKRRKKKGCSCGFEGCSQPCGKQNHLQ